jgi:hypothetical protein
MNLRRRTSGDTIGTAGAPYLAIHAQTLFAGGTEAAKVTRPLDQFGTPGDTTDLDATVNRHGLMPKLDKQKLDGIAPGAQVNPSAASIAASYHSQVPQVSAGEILAGGTTAIRHFSPKNVEDIAAARIAATGPALDAAGAVSAVSAATESTDTVVPSLVDGKLRYDLRRKTSALTTTQGGVGADSAGAFVNLGTAGNTAAAGNDSRFPSADQKAALDAAVSPTAGNPYATVSGVAAAYNSQVPLAGGSDLTNPTAETQARRFSPNAVAAISDQRISSSGIAPLPAVVSQAEAQAGTLTEARTWTPQRVAQAIAALADEVSLPAVVSQAEAESGAGTDARLWTPQRVAQAIAALADEVSLPDVVSQAEAEGGTATTARLWTAQRVFQAIMGAAPTLATSILPPNATQAEAEAGTHTQTRLWSPERVKQAVTALAPTGGGPSGGIVSRSSGDIQSGDYGRLVEANAEEEMNLTLGVRSVGNQIWIFSPQSDYAVWIDGSDNLYFNGAAGPINLAASPNLLRVHQFYSLGSGVWILLSRS